MQNIYYKFNCKLEVVIIAILILLTGCQNNSTNSTNYNSDLSETEITTSQNSSESNDDTLIITNNEDIEYQGEIAEEIERVVNAYKTGDTSGLIDEKDLYVYKKAKSVIQTLIEDDMTDYEKELAIHDYIIANTHYDTDELNELVEVDPDSFTAYGLLKNGKSVCLGYTRTFQLFMDMLDIECITIHSTAYHGEEHAWNMVKLDDEWYHVDVTWDDPLPNNDKKLRHDYFNVTNKLMKNTGHEWDETVFPVATADEYNYDNMQDE